MTTMVICECGGTSLNLDGLTPSCERCGEVVECQCEWVGAEGIYPQLVHQCPRCAALDQ